MTVQPNDLTAKFRHLLHPWEHLGDHPTQNRLLIERGEGVFVYDREGRKLYDGPAGMWCVQIGHGRREIAETMAEQAMKLAYYSPWGLGNVPATELAAKLASLSPGDCNTVLFTTGGSTAVDSALRFVALYNNVKGRPEKKHVISRESAYHGSTYLSASCTGKDRDRNFFDFETQRIHRVSAPDVYRRPAGMSIEDFTARLLAEFEAKILEIGPERCAAFIAEPIQASGGVVVPPPGYLKGMHALCRKHDLLYISDEVVTAFGRLGHWFASEEVFGIQPDIVTVAKGITSGYVPLGATLISDRVLAEIKGEKGQGVNFFHGYTYFGHPVATAVALKNIEIMEREDILGHVREVGPYFQAALRTLADIPIVGDVRGMGLMACVECVISRDSKEPLKLDKTIGRRIDEHAERLGLIVRPLINHCVLSPPLVVTKSQIDEIVAILRQAILLAQEEVRREGLWKE